MLLPKHPMHHHPAHLPPPKHLHGLPIRRIATAHGGTHHAMPSGTLHGRGHGHFLATTELQVAVSIEKHCRPRSDLSIPREKKRGKPSQSFAFFVIFCCSLFFALCCMIVFLLYVLFVWGWILLVCLVVCLFACLLACLCPMCCVLYVASCCCWCCCWRCFCSIPNLYLIMNTPLKPFNGSRVDVSITTWKTA